MKTITIIDAFINDNNQKKLLNNFLLSIKNTGPILLITNSILDESTISKVDYLIYDKKNNLFQFEYDKYDKFYLWNIINNIKLTTCHIHKQKHGLSVLINLFRALNFAKNIGYTHFRRIEYDMILGEKSYNDFSTTPKMCNDNGLKAKFYIDEQQKTHSFQYFFSEIDFFLENFPVIKNEEDYKNIITKEYGSLNFVSVEKLMYNFIKKIDNNNIKIEGNLADVLNDSIWNQSSSDSHISEHIRNCSTDLYKNGDEIVIFTHNKKNNSLHRKIIVTYNDKTTEIFNYEMKNEGEWFLNYLKNNILNIKIYDNDILVFEQKIKEIENLIEFLDK